MTGAAGDDLPAPQPPFWLLWVVTRTVGCCPAQVTGSMDCAALAGPARPADPAPAAKVIAARAVRDLFGCASVVPPRGSV